MSTGIHPWERQDGKSPRAFEAFAAYLEMGAERSLRAVVQECNKSVSLISVWGAAYRWAECGLRAELVRMTAPDEDADRAGISLADEIAAAWERRYRGEG